MLIFLVRIDHPKASIVNIVNSEEATTMKRLFCGALLGASFGLGTLAHADSVHGNFTIRNGVPSSSGGEVTFTLNSDGTIAGSYQAFDTSLVFGFGFDSPQNITDISFIVPPIDLRINGFGNMYGVHKSGFGCFCGPSMSWTIGKPGDYSSVYDVLGGGNASHPFYLTDTTGQWAADAAPIPEPNAALLLAGGLAVLAPAIRRFKR